MCDVFEFDVRKEEVYNKHHFSVMDTHECLISERNIIHIDIAVAKRI